MADWNPIEAVKAQYPNMGLPDAQILQNLQDPEKFRAAFPQYTGVSDDDIRKNVGKFAMAHPEYGTAPTVQKPQVNMQQSAWGIQNNPNQAGAGLPGMTGNRPVLNRDLVPGALAGGAAAAMAAPSLPFIGPALKKIGPVVGPILASEGISQARKLPYVGKFIPPYSEWLPFLIGGLRGKGGSPEVEAEYKPSTDQVPGRPYKPDPRYEPPPRPEPLPPRTQPLFLKGNVEPQPQPSAPNGPTPSNFPTAESRAASDAAFARRYPNEGFQDKMSQPEEAAWQKSAFNKETPDPDIGKKVREQNPEPTRAEVRAAQQKVTPKAVEQEAQKAVGYKPPQRGKPIYDRNPLPEGFKPALKSNGEPSSVLKAYKYDPSTREFESITNDGQHYVHGDVGPEDAQAFEGADSKGRAWQQIQRNPLVRKNGANVKPIANREADPNLNDSNTLINLLTRSLKPSTNP